MEWAARRPPGGLRLQVEHEVQLISEQPALQGEHQAERLLEQLLELLEKRLPELLATQLREQLRVQLKAKEKMEVQTHGPTQVSTRDRILLQILPGELLRVLLDEHQQEAFAWDLVVQTGCVAHTVSRGAGPDLHTYWTGYRTAFGG